MLYRKGLGLAKLTEYIGLLTKLIEPPSKGIAILDNASGLSQANSIEAEIRDADFTFEPALIVLADKIDEEPWSIDKIHCSIALRRLTQALMRCVKYCVTPEIHTDCRQIPILANQ